MGKTMERLINNRLKWHADNINFLPKSQTGVRKGCNTNDNLVRIESTIKAEFNNNHDTTAIFQDVAKAYDRTLIPGLIYKISQANINGNTLRWSKNFRTSRSIQTRIEGIVSEEIEITKGAPQGSVLSPILFNIMLHDFPAAENGCEISLFADDIAIYKTGRRKEETKKPLQDILTQIDEWAKRWKIQFAVNKYASLKFTRKRKKATRHQFQLSGATIKEVTVQIPKNYVRP